MMRSVIKITVFTALAVLIHTLILFCRPVPAPVEPASMPPAAIPVPREEQKPVPLKLAPPPVEVEQQKTTDNEQLTTDKEEPVRLTSIDEKLPEDSQSPVVSGQLEKDSDETKKQTKENNSQDTQEELNSKRMKDAKKKAGQLSIASSQLQEQTTDNGQRTTDEVEDLQKIVKKLSDEEKETVRSGMTETDYRRFLKSLRMGRVKGKPTPQLIHAFHDVAEILAVHRYYGMKIIALEPRNPKTVVEAVGLGSDAVSFQRTEDFNWDLYSNRVFHRTAPYFQEWRRRIVRRDLMPESAKLYSISPNSVDTYFRYKQLEAIRRAGYGEKEVANVVARFHKTDFGGWIMAVERLQLTDGKIITVTDFELEKIANH